MCAAQSGKAQAAASKKRKLLKLKFRGIVQAMVVNKFWLTTIDEEKIHDHTIIQIRRKTEQGFLSLSDKALINSSHSERTVEERKRLAHILLNLKCLSEFCPKTRVSIAPYIWYLYYPAGRIIVREGRDALALYFILQGDVRASSHQWDYITRTNVDQDIAIFGPGECFGEYALIKNTNRVATVISLTDVELLQLSSEAFDLTLRDEMELQWEQKKTAMKSLEYFKSLTPTQEYIACKFSTIKEYKPLQTIYSEDIGVQNPVYFVLSGQCMILQNLKMKVVKVKGHKRYSLFEDDTKVDSKKCIELKSTSSLIEDEESQEATVKVKNLDDVEKHLRTRHESMSAESQNSHVQVRCGVQIIDSPSISVGSELIPRETLTDLYLDQDIHNRRRTESLELIEDTVKRCSGYRGDLDLIRDSRENFENKIEMEIEEQLDEIEEESKFEYEEEAEEAEEDDEEYFEKDDEIKKTRDHRKKGAVTEDYDIENHFIDVGTLSAGAIFGLGENMHDRAIMAKSTVQCILFPRYWLFERPQNPGNIWQKIKFHLDVNIPSRQDLFKDFLNTKKWNKFKSKVIKSTLDETKRSNATKPDDIPIICRIIRGTDE